jgi:predicted DNA binding CopG/RHH family protein
MEKAMSRAKIPKTDSIEELANFWDTHDLTDFENQLEEVSEPPSTRKTIIEISLPSKDANAAKKIAKRKGVDFDELIRQWIFEKIHKEGLRRGRS